jgi:hypothetical protein
MNLPLIPFQRISFSRFLLVRMVKISAISPPEIGCIGHGNIDNAYLGPHLISSWMLSFSGHRLAFKKAPALLKVGIRPVSCACAFSHLACVQHGTTAACGFTLDYSGALLKTNSSVRRVLRVPDKLRCG